MPAPIYPGVPLVSPSGLPLLSPGGVPLVAYANPAGSQDRFALAILELDLDRCNNTFGVAPCTASGTHCYNTFATCKDKTNYSRGTHTIRFGLRGIPAPVGELVRPYMVSVDVAPTEIQPSQGLAVRSQTTCTLVDEPDNDSDLDPYRSTRSTPAAGTFWARLQARNLHSVGRFARLKRGFYALPYSEQHFIEQLFVIDALTGPDQNGHVQVTLSDPIKLLDRAMVPAASDGTLAVELKVSSLSGVLSGATISTVTLPPEALPTDGAYDGMELLIVGNVGNGQRVILSGYSGAARTATVTPAFLVTPDETSLFSIAPLSMTLHGGKGAQYGNAGYVRIGDEILQFTARSGDVLSWPSSTYRSKFGTTAADRSIDSAVQLCRAWTDSPASAVVIDLLNAGNIANSYIDVDLLQSLDTTWLREVAHITACLSKPEKVSAVLADLAIDLNLMLWWHPVEQLVKSAINVPPLAANDMTYTDADFINQSVRVDRQDSLRITQAAQYYELLSATANQSENKNYLRAEIRIDADAQSANEYGDSRGDVRQSRWLTSANQLHVSALVARKVSSLRDAPLRIQFQIDPKSTIDLGSVISVTSKRLTDTEGNAKTLRCRVLKLKDNGANREAEAQSMSFGNRRYAYIAANGQPNFSSASTAQKQYAYICNGADQMSDGTDAYLII